MIFDLDGVLVDSETIWDDARRALAQAHDRPWPEDATHAMMGMSSPEWSAYMHDVVGVPLSTDEISREVVAFVAQRYTEHLPLLPGAQEAVRRLAKHWPLGLASSSNRPIIERFLDASELRQQFRVTVSSEEVERGKPAPDVYLAAAERLGVQPDQCAAIEDSSNGLKAADAAGMNVIAVPNEHFPPDPQTLARATHVISTLDELTPELIRS